MVICLERGADLHMVQLMLLPLTVSCFSKIQVGFTFLVPTHPLNGCVTYGKVSLWLWKSRDATGIFFFSYFVATLSLSLMSTDVRFDDVMIFRSLGHNRVGRIEPDAWQFCQRLIELYVHCTTLQ